MTAASLGTEEDGDGDGDDPLHHDLDLDLLDCSSFGNPSIVALCRATKFRSWITANATSGQVGLVE
jgi:hypothetical protein